MERIVKSMPPEMKRQLQMDQLARSVNARIDAIEGLKRTKFHEPNDRNTLILPEEFTGSDLRRAKKLIRQYRMKK